LQDARTAPDIARDTVPGTGIFCVLTDEPVEQIDRILCGLGIEIVAGPDERAAATGKSLSGYFRDPHANLVEVSNRLAPRAHGPTSCTTREAPPNKALQLTWHNAFQSESGRLLASPWAPQRPSAACGSQLSAHSVGRRNQDHPGDCSAWHGSSSSSRSHGWRLTVHIYSAGLSHLGSSRVPALITLFGAAGTLSWPMAWAVLGI
jgi:hypothetical protein